jgi:hypothetical protein
MEYYLYKVDYPQITSGVPGETWQFKVISVPDAPIVIWNLTESGNIDYPNNGIVSQANLFPLVLFDPDSPPTTTGTDLGVWSIRFVQMPTFGEIYTYPSPNLTLIIPKENDTIWSIGSLLYPINTYNYYNISVGYGILPQNYGNTTPSDPVAFYILDDTGLSTELITYNFTVSGNGSIPYPYPTADYNITVNEGVGNTANIPSWGILQHVWVKQSRDSIAALQICNAAIESHD